MTESPRPAAELPRAPINWPATLMLTLTAIPAVLVLPPYLYFFDVHPAAWLWGALLWAATGTAITAGYHRLWSHRAYKAHPLLKWWFAFFGAMAVQNSILNWAAGHREHHRHVDDPDRDPYAAPRGFWFSHIGWMLRDYPSGQVDYSRVPDLLADKVVMCQHRHYLWFAFGSNFGVVLLLGWLYGDVLGFVLVAGFARLCFSHHATFFINSLAHMWGRRPYTAENTARDNDLLALLTWGEGYHNYHHLFQYDYRNGVRWWQYDPTKWLIALAARVGLASGLRRVSEVKIQQARVARQFEIARERLAAADADEHGALAQLRDRLDEEWQHFTQVVQQFAAAQGARFAAVRDGLQHRWSDSELKSRVDGLERQLAGQLRDQRRRLRRLYRDLHRALAAPQRVGAH